MFDLKENMATLLDVISKQMDRIFPIGSYFCAETATNPSVLLGFGTWEQLKDRMLIGVGDSFALSSVGGEINHTLTNAEMPSHTHDFMVPPRLFAERNNDSDAIVCTNANESTNAMIYATTSAGGNVAHNNMPPYKAVYIWKRIA